MIAEASLLISHNHFYNVNCITLKTLIKPKNLEHDAIISHNPISVAKLLMYF